MKKINIVLSFDDCLIDFKENAYPLLKLFNLKATLNVISGYSDSTVEKCYDYISLSDVKKFYEEGFEIAVHSNSHLRKTSYEDIIICKEKLSKLLGINEFGIILPYSQKITDELLYSLKKDFLYVADVHHPIVKRAFFGSVLRFVNHFMKNKSINKIVMGYKYFEKVNNYKNPSPIFDRLPVGRLYTPNIVLKTLKRLKKDECITLTFHSILKNINDACDWPLGAWTIDEFRFFLSKITNTKRYNVIRQIDLIHNIKE